MHIPLTLSQSLFFCSFGNTIGRRKNIQQNNDTNRNKSIRFLGNVPNLSLYIVIGKTNFMHIKFIPIKIIACDCSIVEH